MATTGQAGGRGDTSRRFAVAAEWDGQRLEWGIMWASDREDMEKKARSLLRDNGIPDSVRPEIFTHVR